MRRTDSVVAVVYLFFDYFSTALTMLGKAVVVVEVEQTATARQRHTWINYRVDRGRERVQLCNQQTRPLARASSGRSGALLQKGLSSQM
jgi:hypothetical protein